MSSTKTIGEQLAILFRLQDIDGKIYALTREKNEKPLELDALRKRRDDQKQSVAAQERELTGLQVKRKNEEMDLETKEEGIKKYQIQLYQVKTNKEYQSLQKEIETLKADNSVLEEEILQIMEVIDQKKKDLAHQKETLTSVEGELTKEQARVKEETVVIEKELSALKARRQGIIPEVDRRLFERYDRILVSKEGLALVAVEGNSCGGCHIHLPPQVINEVQLQEKLVICENCSRILYERNERSDSS